MTLLGLDLASRLTGFCVGDGSAVPEVGAWEMPRARTDDGYDYGRLLAGLEDYLDIPFKRFRIEAVAYEAPILITRRGDNRPYVDNLNKLRLLYPLGAFVEWYCFRAGVPCYEVTVQSIKSEVTGNHIAPKGDLVAVAKQCGLRLPDGPGIEDAADAWGAWLLLLRATDKHMSAAWDQRIWTPKGALL